MIALLACIARGGVLEHPEAEVEVPSTRVGAVPLPRFAGTGGTLASGRQPSPVWVTGSIGFAVSRSLFPGRGISGFPAVAAAMEHRTPLGRAWIGLDSAPLLLQAGNSAYWHLALLSAGLTSPGPHLRGGPYTSVGLVGVSAGWRVLFTPFEGRSGAVRGLEARLAANVGPDREGRVLWTEPSGEAILMYTGTFQLGRDAGRWDPAPVALPEDAPREDLLTCRRLVLGLGLAAGASSTRLSWELIGTGQTVEASASPAVAIACETGGSAGLLISGESAPVYRYRVPWDDQGSDQLASHLGSVTLGPVIGGDGLRVSPVVQAGIWTLGAGLRLAITPITSERGHRHGLEVRGIALWPSAPSGEALLLYTAVIDPRRGAVDRR